MQRSRTCCRKPGIKFRAQFALFGSILRGAILRGGIEPAGDVDVLVTVGDDTRLTLYDWVEMADELKEIFGREIDHFSKSGLRNSFRRHEIQRTRKVIYASTGS
ncbi:MAG: nucleotidyltransferase domain-containing protein [Desulfomonilaceae bacterium]|nr:nucleotidyltransferase domain-containing protein [Desulfomonilaceae bacterium]